MAETAIATTETCSSCGAELGAGILENYAQANALLGFDDGTRCPECPRPKKSKTNPDSKASGEAQGIPKAEGEAKTANGRPAPSPAPDVSWGPLFATPTSPDQAARVELVPLGADPPGPRQPAQQHRRPDRAGRVDQKRGPDPPLVVTPISPTDFQVVYGHRRLAAAELAGEKTVPVISRDMGDSQRQFVMLIENLHREDLSPIDEARGYQQLIDVFELSQRDIAGKVGRGQSHITKRLQLLGLSPKAQVAVDSGGITLEAAAKLLKLRGAGPDGQGPLLRSARRRMGH